MRIPLLATLLTSSLLALGCGGPTKPAATPAATAVEPAPVEAAPPEPAAAEAPDQADLQGTSMVLEEGRMGRRDAAASDSPPAAVDPSAPDESPGAGAGAGAPPPAARSAVRPPETAIGNPTVTGGKFEPASVRLVMRRNQARLNYCYERELVAKPTLAGTVVFNFTIAPPGVVIEAAITKSTLSNASAEKCMLDTLRRIEYGKLPGAKVMVTLPIIFKASR